MAGKVAVPVIGTLRFVYRIGTNEVDTEVAAVMCSDCGLVQLRAKNPGVIRSAERAARFGRTRPTRWRPRPDESPERTDR